MTDHEELRRLATEANRSGYYTPLQKVVTPDVVLELLDSIRRADELEAQQSETILHQAGEIARLLTDLDALRTRLAEVEKDAARLNWIQRHLFVHKWNGVIDSGSQTRWDIWGGYRHITATMIGNTFGEAIDNAAKEQA